MQLHRNQVSTKRHYVGGVVLRSVAPGVVCCRRYAQLGGNRRLGFCNRNALWRTESYWIGCVASDSSDLDADLPTRDGEHPRLVVLSLVFRQHAA
jgi:hypothetical protein